MSAWGAQRGTLGVADILTVWQKHWEVKLARKGASGAGQSSGVAYNSPGASTTFIHSFSSFIQIFLDPFGILATALGTELSLMRETENRTASAGGHTHWKVGRGKLER